MNTPALHPDPTPVRAAASAALLRAREPARSDPPAGPPTRQSASVEVADAGTRPALGTQAVALLLADFAPGARLWGWLRMVRGPGALRGTPGLRFAKVMGSGHEGGFGLRPSKSLQAVFAVFDTEAQAARFIAQAPIVHAYRDRARELVTLRLLPYSCRGSWDGRGLTPSIDPPASVGEGETTGPIAALTRASIRPLAAARFWRHAPPSQADLGQAAGCQLAIGLGEAPLFRQATFSVWDSVRAMDAYARSGAHMAAIRASVQQGFFSESMFVRFVLRSIDGVWKGRRYTGTLPPPVAAQNRERPEQRSSTASTASTARRADD